MDRIRYFLGVILICGLLIGRGGQVLAASALEDIPSISGVIQGLLLETDPTTGVTTIVISIMDQDQFLQEVRISQETALTLGILVLDEDGKPLLNSRVVGEPIEIDPAIIIPEEEAPQHPVAMAIATFFSNVPGVSYETVMRAHQAGNGYAAIAQALWLTSKMGGNSDVFQTIMEARQTGDYSAFLRENGTSPKTWGELRNAILKEKNGLRIVTSD